MRVLLVDNDAAYVSGCATILRADGHDVVTCSDFAEGRRLLLADDHFDVLITDVRLGAYNGLHLIALAAPMVKIALSAFDDPVIRRDAEQAGARFVVKPEDCDSISALLSHTDQARATRRR